MPLFLNKSLPRRETGSELFVGALRLRAVLRSGVSVSVEPIRVDGYPRTDYSK